MKASLITVLLGRPKKYLLFPWHIYLALAFLCCGCQKEVSKNESVSLWPAFNSEKTFLVDEQGTHHLTDTGSAFLIANWDKSAKIDKLGNIIYRREDVTIWPFFEIHEKVDLTSKHSRGTILLLFHYDTLLTVASPDQPSD